MKKGRQMAVIAVFVCIIGGFVAGHILSPDQALSKQERRKLAVLPEMTKESLLSETYMTDLEAYLMDQFPLREKLRTAKAVITLDLLGQKDNHHIYEADGGLYKWENKLKPREIAYFADKINDISCRYLTDNQVYYSIIPDKNYFAAGKNGYPALDYDKLYSTAVSGVTEAEYVDITRCLELSDYYRTDTHWKQTALKEVVQTLGKAMHFEKRLPSWKQYEVKKLSPFYGVFLGQSALPEEPDTLQYLTNKTIENAVVTSAEVSGTMPVYTVKKFSGMDGYDVFLGGAQAVLSIENEEAETDKELILFRDSFGSSLAPLLINAYRKITLVDLRYIAADYVPQFIDIEDQDVLFIYSASLVNGAMVLK